MTRTWTCRSCKWPDIPRVKQRCPVCKAKRPKVRPPAHRKVLATMPYEQWVQRFGEQCGICGRAPSARRRLDRDHCHGGAGTPRGLLCARCNRSLPSWMTADWLLKAAAYLARSQNALTQSGIIAGSLPEPKEQSK